MKIFVVSLLLLIVGAFAANENDGTKSNNGVKTKRAYTLGYGFSDPLTYDHDFIEHEPIVHHTPLAAAITHPVFPATAIHAPLVHAPVAKTSIVSTSVHHLPSTSYIGQVHAPILSPAAAYVAHHPLYTEYHRR
ncbi:hypothetical protein PVAND_008145 [Polypedilum vanderplanki]|uniref:Uncharacterized protein n=1 Tax=Polypedilum vanderplanki TaxID=319348 RepID=A0A9J6C9N2_POLVA|nr:hypothetical protein PVAND_008145 [Polypedilum vanderplanki]